MSTDSQPVPNTAALLAVLNRIAVALGTLAAIASTIYAAWTSSPTLRGVIFGGTALATSSAVTQVHLTKRSAHRASIAESHAVAAVAAQRAAEAQARPAVAPGGNAA